MTSVSLSRAMSAQISTASFRSLPFRSSIVATVRHRDPFKKNMIRRRHVSLILKKRKWLLVN